MDIFFKDSFSRDSWGIFLKDWWKFKEIFERLVDLPLDIFKGFRDFESIFVSARIIDDPYGLLRVLWRIFSRDSWIKWYMTLWINMHNMNVLKGYQGYYVGNLGF